MAPEPPSRPASRPSLQERLARIQEQHGGATAADPLAPCPGECGHTVDDCQCEPPTDAEAEATLLDAFPGAKVERSTVQRSR